jgi:hypothetical protein
MTRPIALALLFSTVVFTLALTGGCGDESGRASCPSEGLELYDLRDGGAMDPEVARALAEKGCITLPSPEGLSAAAGAGGN